jgi:hypothetical protein
MSVKPVLARNKQHCDTHMAQCAPRMGRRDGKYDLPLSGPDAGVAFHVWDIAHSPASRAAGKRTTPLSFLVPDKCSSPNRGCAIKTRTAFEHRFAYDASPVCYCRSEQNQTTQRRGFISRINGKPGIQNTQRPLVLAGGGGGTSDAARNLHGSGKGTSCKSRKFFIVRPCSRAALVFA